jgi:hypothetical protein
MGQRTGNRRHRQNEERRRAKAQAKRERKKRHREERRRGELHGAISLPFSSDPAKSDPLPPIFLCACPPFKTYFSVSF